MVDSYDKVTTHKKALRILYLNARSLAKPGKLDELKCILQALCMIHVIAVTETWVKSESEGRFLHIPNYKHYFNYRTNSRGGGVSIYIRQDLRHNIIENVCRNDNHFLWIHMEKFCIDLGVVYKPERTNTDQFLELFSDQLQQRKRAIVMGDFNYNLLDKKKDTKEYKQALRSNGYYILNKINKNFCTRETADTKTILDHVITNLNGHSYHLAIVDSAMSDHKQIYFEILRTHPDTVTEVNYEKVDYTALLKSIKSANIHNIDDYNKLETLLIDIINANKITKVKKLNRPKSDWINKEIINSIQQRNIKWVKTKNAPDNEQIKKEFLFERKKTFEDIQTAKSNFYYKAFKECSGKPLKMWNLINELSSNKIRDKYESPILKVQSETITNELKVCEHFNDFFSSIGSQLACKIPKEYHETNLIIDTKPKILSELEPTSYNEIVKIIDNLRLNTSSGIDGISTKIVKSIKTVLAEPLSKIINQCLKNGIFPDSLKIAKVTPIFKSGDKCDPSNYRPISVLPVISKIFEKVLYNRLAKHLDSSNFLYKGQYGFRPKSNTLTATTDLITNIKVCIDEKKVALGIFIDLKKAFDTVSHSLLIKKLNKYVGVTETALDIFKSYLTNRYQIVKIGQSKSRMKRITYGVPQGSLLGPILFLIYINDMHEIGLHGRITLYADDTCLFYFGSKVETIINQAQNDLNLLQNWFLRNLLTINESKTKYMIFAAVNKKLNEPPPLTINNVTIQKSIQEKYLGLILDDKLSWNPHIQKLRSKLISLSGILRNIVRYLPLKVRYTIYNSLVKPHLDYLINIWGSAPKTNLRGLQIAQNKIIKILFNYDYLTPTRKIYKDTKLFDIKQNYIYNTCIIIRKILTQDVHCSITFTKKHQIQKIKTRSANNLILRAPRTKYGRTSILYDGAQLYNKLPKDIKDAKSIRMFKTSLKQYLINMDSTS